MANIVPDTSFLIHALIPSQRTVAAESAILSAIESLETTWTIPSSVYLEFPSLLRKLVTRRRIRTAEADAAFSDLQDIPSIRVGPDLRSIDRAWEIATRFGQSDIFDSFGLAVAEEFDGIFWTSDLRFYNVVSAAFGPERIQYFP